MPAERLSGRLPARLSARFSFRSRSKPSKQQSTLRVSSRDKATSVAAVKQAATVEAAKMKVDSTFARLVKEEEALKKSLQAMKEAPSKTPRANGLTKKGPLPGVWCKGLEQSLETTVTHSALARAHGVSAP